MLLTFKTLSDYNTYTTNGTELVSGICYYVEEDGSCRFLTNNIDGTTKVYTSKDISKTIMVEIEITNPSSQYNTFFCADAIEAFSKVEIEGIGELDEVTNVYTSFPSAGTYTVYLYLVDNTTVPVKAFYNCSLIKSIKLPDTITTISEQAFDNCYNAIMINLPSKVTSIGQKAFNQCNYLMNNYVIPEGVTAIPNDCFNGCYMIEKISLPSTLTSIGNNAFYFCEKLYKINTDNDIPSGVTSIGQSAFSTCKALTSVIIPSTVSSISDSAFYTCSKLSSVTVLAETPPTLGSSVFNSNKSGRKIYVDEDSVDAYKAANGWSTYASDINSIID